MEIQTQLGTTVEVQPTSRAIPIFDNQIDHPATLIVDFAAYTASFAFPNKPETFRIHMEMFIVFSPDLKAANEIHIAPNIQTSKFITYSQTIVDDVNDCARQLEQFFIVHYFENNTEQVIYNTIVEAIKSCNNPIYSIFFYERDFRVFLAGKEYFVRHNV